ncbi:MAG: hypothetical protein HC888_06300, partial [Candidatus Competibacteraceae bacterium]|nr:hypothetical protein [Candidatus Competibacteraceae bacterium]
MPASVLFFCIALLGCEAYGQDVELQRGDTASFQTGREDTRLSFESNEVFAKLELAVGRGVLFTDSVKINGRSAGFFLLDTGSNISVIAADASKMLGIKPGEASLAIEGRDVGGTAKVDLAVGPLKIKDCPIGILDLTPIQKFSKPVIGILGADVLGKIPFTLDYREACLVLHNPSRFSPPEDARAFDLLIVKHQRGPGLEIPDVLVGTPAVMGGVNGYELTMVLDTGLSRGVFIGRSDASKQPARIGRLIPPFREATVLANQASDMHEFDLSRLDVLGKLWADVQYAMTPVPSDEALTDQERETRFSAIGGTLLREFRLTFDIPHKRLWVSPSVLPHLTEREIEEKNFAGVLPIIEAVEYGDLPRLKLLLARGASLSYQDESGYGILHLAVIGGCPRCVELLLSQKDRPKVDDVTPRRRNATDSRSWPERT